MNAGSGSDNAVVYSEHIEIQNRLLTGQMTRLDLAGFLSTPSHSQFVRHVAVRIWRNYAVEPMENWFKAAGNFWGTEYELEFTGYDDSFSFAEFRHDDRIQCEVLIVDRHHYSLPHEDFLEWLVEREHHLANLTTSNCFTVLVDDEILIRSGGVTLETLTGEMTNGFFDSRYEKATGSRLKPETHSLIARELACSWLPSRFVPPKKLVAVDLDFTLHGGILGEGIEGLVLDESYLELQDALVAAKERGFMLAILSKNDKSDVMQLLRNVSSYRLSENDFVAIEASWGQKSEGMARILDLTRINQDSVVFLDDNPVELLQMKSAFPGMSVVSAANGPRDALLSLRYVPGFRRPDGDSLADVRISDLKSNEEREILIQNGLSMYYRSASPVLKVSINNAEDLERLVDLGKRSNQFNVLLSRSDRDTFEAESSAFVSLALTDRFSDSGIIGGILLRRTVEESTCELVDLFLSCRVLGRGLESTLICRGFLETMDSLAASHVRVSWVVAERNEPALKWLGDSLLQAVPQENGTVLVSREEIEKLAVPPEGVTCEVTRRD